MTARTQDRARAIQRIIKTYHKPGSHVGCLKWIWRYKVRPVMPMTYRTFINYTNRIKIVS